MKPLDIILRTLKFMKFIEVVNLLCYFTSDVFPLLAKTFLTEEPQ